MRSVVAALGLSCPLLASAAPGVAAIRVSDDPEAWFEDQGPFDGQKPVFVFVELDTADHEPFYFSGECYVAHAATGVELARVRAGSARIDHGVDRVRTPSFDVAWPSTAVTVTCVPDYDPNLSLSATLDPWTYSRDHGTPGPQVLGPAVVQPQSEAPEAELPVERIDPPQPLPLVDETPISLLDEAPIGEEDFGGVVVAMIEPEAAPVSIESSVCEEALAAHGYIRDQAVCADVAPLCAVALLDNGWSPLGMAQCAGVDEGCAVRVLDEGGSPGDLAQCR